MVEVFLCKGMVAGEHIRSVLYGVDQMKGAKRR